MSRYWSSELLPSPLNKDPGFKQLEWALDQLYADATAYALALLTSGTTTLSTLAPYLLLTDRIQFLKSTDPVPTGAILATATDSGFVSFLAPATPSVPALVATENAAGRLRLT